MTDGDGYEFAPRYSPDGKWIAFTGNRGGVQDVYVMPAAGGNARRLTTLPAAPPSNGVRRTSSEGLVVAWTPDSTRIVFLTRRSTWTGQYRPATVPVAGGAPSPLPIDRSGYLSYGPDGHSFALTRTFTEFKTWKRYDGGQAEDIEIYDPTTRTLKRITDWKGRDGTPMWVGRRIYFVSDRDAHRRANLWVHDLDTGRDRQLTHFTDFDIDLPSCGGGRITFQQGGQLWRFDLASEQVRRVDVAVPEYDAQTRPRVVSVAGLVREQDTGFAADYALSPAGDTAAFSARGDIFLVPARGGAARNLTATSNADDDHPAFSPDGKFIAYTSDAGGEHQLMVRGVDGGPARQLTRFRSGFLYMPVWSPDGRWIAVPDGAHRLWLVAVDGSVAPKVVAVDRNHFMHETDQQDAAFSADGRWLAYSVARPTRTRELHLYEIATGADATLSAPDESDYRPAFSPDGLYLYFVSDRHAVSVQSDRETAAVQVKSQGIYVAALSAMTPPRFGPDGKGGPPTILGTADVDVSGLMGRAVPASSAPAHITFLAARAGGVFYVTQAPDTLDGSLPGELAALHRLDADTGRDKVVIENPDSLILSLDGRHALYKSGDEWRIAATDHSSVPSIRLSLTDMRATVDPRQEWGEMFENAWRLERDLFVNPDMNGTNWRAVHDAYRRLLPQVATRDDLNFLIGEMIGELSSSHTYVGGGDDGQEQTGADLRFLGADYELDAASGRYRIAKVYAGDNTRLAYRGPLSWPGLDIRVGDYVLAVDGHPLTADGSPDALLTGVGTSVALTVSRMPNGVPRNVRVAPVSSETALRRLDWEQTAQATTDRLSGGRVGYVHLSDMQNLGMEEFVQRFYSQLGKEALVIDERWNGGGNTDQIVLERLRRVLSSMQTLRGHAPQTQPDQIQVGPKAMLINHFAGSDGDMFPYHFRAYGLGPLVGTRPWGGVRGIEWFWPLLDGGYVTIPQISFYDAKGQWVVENHGVEPDVDIEDRPDEVVTHGDVQLEAAIKLLMSELPASPRRPIPVPSGPDYPPDGQVPPASMAADPQ